MYAVTPEVEALWRELLARVAAEAGVALDYVPYPAPRPLEDLWRRPDLGCVFMCGYPIVLRIADVCPIAAPIPAAAWAAGRPVYRSDLIVRREAPFLTLADSFGRRAESFVIAIVACSPFGPSSESVGANVPMGVSFGRSPHTAGSIALFGIESRITWNSGCVRSTTTGHPFRP